ncbi:MAG: DUF2191 domain-containing protein [Desulfobulbaceae bacterium A2]|nr:MAG: DUF2191 domain-containing protein [Desulfobulbaceae bacterium A2]
MRTTLTIDDQLSVALREVAHRSGKPFKQVVNEALRKGLNAFEHPPAQPYRLRPASLGTVRAGIHLDKALALADDLEDAVIATELELRK